MIIQVYEHDYISKFVGEAEVPDDASEEEIEAAAEKLLDENGMSGLCHHCAGSVGDLSGAQEVVIEGPDGTLRDDTHTSTLQGQIDALKAELEAMWLEREALLSERD